VGISAVLFDFDGLIIDSETPLFDIWTAIYAEHGQTLTLDAWQHALGTHGGFDPVSDLLERTARSCDPAALADRVTSEHWRTCADEPLQPGVLERLDEARQLGLRTAVASSSSAEWVRPWLSRHGLLDRFDAICTRDDVNRVKPAPDLFALAAERLGVAAETCLVFEDSPNGIRAARAAGMHVVAVPRGLTRTLPLPGPDLIVDSLADLSLPGMLERLALVAAPQANASHVRATS
jgi:HAD superfamily hydrolase (TIGR01509 family)